MKRRILSALLAAALFIGAAIPAFATGESGDPIDSSVVTTWTSENIKNYKATATIPEGKNYTYVKVTGEDLKCYKTGKPRWAHCFLVSIKAPEGVKTTTAKWSTKFVNSPDNFPELTNFVAPASQSPEDRFDMWISAPDKTSASQYFCARIDWGQDVAEGVRYKNVMVDMKDILFEEAVVSTADDLISAASNPAAVVIKLDADIELNAPLLVTHPVQIDGQGHKITCKAAASNDAKNAFTFMIQEQDGAPYASTSSALRNLTLENVESGGSVLHVYDQKLNLDQCSINANGAGAAILVNGSTVTAYNTLALTLGENAWYGINVDSGTDISSNKSAMKFGVGSIFTVKSTDNAKDAICVEEDTGSQFTVANASNRFTLSEKTTNEKKQTIYHAPLYAVAIADDISGGSIKAAVNGTESSLAQAGDEVTITATANDGYELKADTLKVTKTGGVETVAVADNKFTMPDCAVTVSGEFVEKSEVSSVEITYPTSGTKVVQGDTYTCTADVTAVGGADKTITWSVSGNSSNDTKFSGNTLTIAEEETAGGKLTITAAAGGKSDSVEVTVAAKETEGPDVPVPEETTFPLAVNIEPAGSGTVTVTITGKTTVYTIPDDTVKILKGDEVTLAASPEEGYRFTGWADDKYTKPFTMKQAETFTANFEKIPAGKVVVTFNANGGSNVASQTIDKGAKATKPADPSKDGFTFAGWYADKALTTAFDFGAPVTADTTVYAKWEQKDIPPLPTGFVEVTVKNNGSGRLALTSSALFGDTPVIVDPNQWTVNRVEEDSKATLKIAPALYGNDIITAISVNGKVQQLEAGEAGAYTVTLTLTEETVITVETQEATPVPVEPNQDANVEPDGNTEQVKGVLVTPPADIPAGTQISVVGLPKENLGVQSLLSKNPSSTFAAALDLSVFEVKGNVHTPLVGHIFTFKILLDLPPLEANKQFVLYHIENGVPVRVNGASVTNSVLTFRASSFSPYVLTIEPKSPSPSRSSGGSGFSSYWITAEAGPNGSISPDGENRVAFGDSLTVTVTPNAGYVVDKVVVDGTREVTLTNSQYTFKNVNEPYTIKATFKKASGTAEAPAAPEAKPTTPTAVNPATGDNWFAHLFDGLFN